MVTGYKLSKDDESPEVNQSTYRSMICILLYLTASRPDIMQVEGLVASFQANPKEIHVNAVKRIFKYLRGTIKYGLWYLKGKYFSLIAYVDTDWVGSIDDKKNTLGATFFLGNIFVSLESKKHNSISLSTVEAKYVETTTCCTQILWME